MIKLQLWLLAALVFAQLSPAQAIDLPDRRDPREPTLTDALNAAILGKRPLDDFTITARWTGLPTITVWGEGLGILESKQHFLIEREQYIALLKLLRKANFVNLPERFGDAPQPGRPQKSLGQLTLLVGEQKHQKHTVTQSTGEIYEELEELTREIITTAQQAASNTVAPATLAEALDLLNSGKLPPRALRLVLMTTPTNEADGLMLELQGRKLTSRTRSLKGGFTNQQSRLLEEAEWTNLLSTLCEQQAATLPTHLPHESYLTLNVGALGKGLQIQARPDPKLKKPIEPSPTRGRFLKVLEQLKTLAAPDLAQPKNKP